MPLTRLEYRLSEETWLMSGLSFTFLWELVETFRFWHCIVIDYLIFLCERLFDLSLYWVTQKQIISSYIGFLWLHTFSYSEFERKKTCCKMLSLTDHHFFALLTTVITSCSFSSGLTSNSVSLRDLSTWLHALMAVSADTAVFNKLSERMR